MAITYPMAVKTARMNATKTALGASGKLEIGTAGMALVLATIPLGSGGTVSNGVWTIIASATSDPAADNSGTPAAARIRTSGDVDIVTGLTVGLSAADVILDSLSITAGQEVKINSATITHAA